MGAVSDVAEQVFAHQGFQEITLSTGDIGRASEVYQRLFGFEVATQGQTDPAVLAGYGLADLAAQEVVLRRPESAIGCLRLMQFGDGSAPMIRPAGRTWDTGGIFDFNVRVRDIHELFNTAMDLGFSAYGAPAQFQWAQFKVWEVVLHGPDGVAIALIQPIEPGPEAFLGNADVSPVFNATQVVADLDEVRAFYGGLGFQLFVDDSFVAREPGQLVLGLPLPLADSVRRNICIFHPSGGNEGSLEFLQFDGISGMDFSDRALPPNRGLMSFRFPVADAAAVPDAHRLYGPVTTELAPYGVVQMTGLKGPNGTLLEFFSQAG